MPNKKNIFVINGSASKNSANEKLIAIIAKLTADDFDLTVFNELRSLPHFDPELSISNIPPLITKFRNQIENADGILFCTPEYIFSIPSGLKNAIEWCVSTTIFTDKPIGIVTASANGQKGHEELQLIMKIVMSKFTDQTTLLIQGIKGKIKEDGVIIDNKTLENLRDFISAFKILVNNANSSV